MRSIAVAIERNRETYSVGHSRSPRIAYHPDGGMELGPIVLPAVALLCAVVEYAAEQTGTTPDAVLFDLRQRVTEPL